MKIEISSRPVFRLPLPLETVNLLMIMSRHHDDGHCKSAAAVGGFLCGWSTSVTHAPEGPVSATLDQLDTLLKICENMAIWPDKSEAPGVIWKLTTDVRRAISYWRLTSEDWSTVIDTEAKPCKTFIEQATRADNAATARRLLTKLGVIDQYDGSGLVAALTELQQLRAQLGSSQ